MSVLSYWNINVFLWCSDSHIIQYLETTVWTHPSVKQVWNNWIMICYCVPPNPILNCGRRVKQVSKKPPRTCWTLSPLLASISISCALLHWYIQFIVTLGMQFAVVASWNEDIAVLALQNHGQMVPENIWTAGLCLLWGGSDVWGGGERGN